MLTHGRRESPVSRNARRPPTAAFLGEPQRRGAFWPVARRSRQPLRCASPLVPPPAGLGRSWGGPGPGLPARAGGGACLPALVTAASSHWVRGPCMGSGIPPPQSLGRRGVPTLEGLPQRPLSEQPTVGQGACRASAWGAPNCGQASGPHGDTEHDPLTALEHEGQRCLLSLCVTSQTPQASGWTGNP